MSSLVIRECRKRLSSRQPRMKMCNIRVGECLSGLSSRLPKVLGISHVLRDGGKERLFHFLMRRVRCCRCGRRPRCACFHESESPFDSWRFEMQLNCATREEYNLVMLAFRSEHTCFHRLSQTGPDCFCGTLTVVLIILQACYCHI